MKLSFSQTGGFAGLTKSLDLDTVALSESDRAIVDGLLRPLDLFQITIPNQDFGPDMFHYFLRIEEGSQKRELSFHDGNVPDGLQPLLRYLSTHASYAPLK